ncbi:hypothetical protein TNCV_2196291 [Trichonephila clavipes]|nr:hypothetical protein TNCV_2196291 [Trichonephila clavipes]
MTAKPEADTKQLDVYKSSKKKDTRNCPAWMRTACFTGERECAITSPFNLKQTLKVNRFPERRFAEPSTP